MFEAGQKIGLYVLIRKLGRGGFGEVWLAEKRTQFIIKKVAIKLPHDDQINFDSIHQEATLWEEASGHPNVLPIIDADVCDGQVIIVSEYANGGSLADKLKIEGKLPIAQAVEMTIGVLSGLDYLHSKKIIHRDIKPQNILLQGDTPRLADFGISRAMNTSTISSAIIGTDSYMAPEAFQGKRNVQTDVWSVGVLLYALLANNLPFPQEHPSERMYSILMNTPEPLANEVPQKLREVVEKALAKQPENRYQSARQMREELQNALIGITHPTFAKTEVFNKSSLLPPPPIHSTPVMTTKDPAIQANQFGRQNPEVEKNNLTEVTEIKTILNSSSADQQQLLSSPAAPPKSEQNALPENNPVNSVAAGAGSDLPQQARFDVKVDNNKYTLLKKPEVIIIVSILSIFILAAGASFLSGSKLSSLYAKPTPTPNPYDVYTDLSKFQDGSKYGYKNSKGSIIIPAKYDDVGYYFREGFAPVKLNGKWTYIDENDKPLTSFMYDYGQVFGEGIAFVYLNSKWGAIDRTGKEVLPFIYESPSIFSNGLTEVTLNGKVGYIDKTGKEIIPFKFTSADNFDREGYASACIGEYPDIKCAMIDKTGKEITPFKYHIVFGFHSDDLSIVELNNKYGYIDKTGKEVIPLLYDSYGTEDGLGNYLLQRNGRKYRVDKNGNETDIGEATPTPAPAPASNSNMTITSNSNSNTGP